MLLFVTMILVGVLIGFTGAGGAGTVIAVLTAIFSIPVHTNNSTCTTSTSKSNKYPYQNHCYKQQHLIHPSTNFCEYKSILEITYIQLIVLVKIYYFYYLLSL